MALFNKYTVKRYSFFTVLLFIFSLFGGYLPAVHGQNAISIQVDGNASLEALGTVIPQISNLQSKIQGAQSTINSLERVCSPIHDAIAPSNMDTMNMAQRMKAIINNAKSVLGSSFEGAKHSANSKLNSGGSITSLSRDEQIAFSIDQLSAQAAKLETHPKSATSVAKIKEVLGNTKDILGNVITTVRGKIFDVGQKVGLIDQNKVFEDGKVIDASESKYGGKNPKMLLAGKTSKPSFSDKLTKGITDGKSAAKSSLKSSFSFSNLMMTTTVAVGTNLAIDVMNGNRPSLKKAAKSVASLEFAGSVVGSALGAAGGQFAGTVVKTLVPGVVGNLVGSVIPVMFSSASGQLSANLVTGIKNGRFSVSDAFAQIDKVDLIGSSIGSTIGMSLGAVVPVFGPIIGGIVGGFLGSRIAKWITGGSSGKTVSSGKSISTVGSTLSTPMRTGISVGNISAGLEEGVIAAGAPAGFSPEVQGSINLTAEQGAQLEEAEQRYYKAYLEYNRLIQANETKKAKEMFEQLKQYSDEYNAIKRSFNN